MGSLSSKLFNKSSNPDNYFEPRECKKSKVLINDPRSPTEGVVRTPIVINGAQQKPYLETDFDVNQSPNISTYKNANPWPLTKRIYKNLGVDPNKFDSPYHKQKYVQPSSLDSPTSEYSYNCSQAEADETNLTAPEDPSAYVSDLDGEMPEYQKEFLGQIEDLIYSLKSNSFSSSPSNSTFGSQVSQIRKEAPVEIIEPKPEVVEEIFESVEPEIITEEEIIETPECLEPEIVQEILEPEITEEPKVKTNTLKHKKSIKSNIPVKVEKENVKVTPPYSKIPVKAKSRTPLGNITSAHNSPVQILKVKQSQKVKKVQGRSEGVENVYIGKQNKIMVEWDNDNTIII